MSELFSSPFNLAAGAEINAKVKATNAVGTAVLFSTASSTGGQVVITPPTDKPVPVRDASTTESSVVFTWSAIASSGGSAVTGYEVLLRQVDQSYSVVATKTSV
jgi:hypothetical protein